MSGWIKLHRDLVKHWIYSFDDPDKALAWIDLIMMARHDDGEILLKGRVQRVSRGQVAMSQLALQKRWRWSQNKVKRFLKLLKNERMVDFQANDLTTIISICKYEEYQERERPDGRALERPVERPVERTTNDQSNDDIRREEGEEGKNITPFIPLGGIAKPKKKSTAFKKPTVDEVREYCEERKNSIDPESFVDSYEAKGWMIGKSKMKSWKACVRTWEKRANETHQRPGNGNSKQIDHTDTSWVEQYNAEYGGS